MEFIREKRVEGITILWGPKNFMTLVYIQVIICCRVQSCSLQAHRERHPLLIAVNAFAVT